MPVLSDNITAPLHRILRSGGMCVLLLFSLPRSSHATTGEDTDRMLELEAAEQVMREQPGAAREAILSVLPRAEQARDLSAQAHAHTLLGLIAMRQGLHADAITQFEQSVRLAEAGEDLPRLARALASLGVVFDLSGLRSEALVVQQRALDISIEHQEWPRASALLINLGNTYGNQGDNVRARDSYRQALAMKREHGIARGIGSVLNNLADLELADGDAAAAELLLRDAITAHRSDGNVDAESVAHGNLARALTALGQYSEAAREIDVAKALALPVSNARAIVAADTALAELHLARARATTSSGESRQQLLRHAAAAAEAARTRAVTLEDSGRLADLARMLADIRIAQGAATDAVPLLQEAARLDRVESERADGERYAVLAARYQSEKQSGEIALLQQREAAQAALMAERESTQQLELSRQRGWALALLFAVIGLLGVAALLLRRARERQAYGLKLESSNRRLSEALLEAQSLRERSDAVASVNRRLLQLAGEDMRSPLLTLRSGAERLLVDDDSPAVRTRRVAGMAQAAAELLRIADQMLESATLEATGASPVMDPVSLAPLLAGLVEQLHAQAQGRGRSVVLQQLDDAIVRADTTRLVLSLQELLDLVLGSAPVGSRIDVHLQRCETDALVSFGHPSLAGAGSEAVLADGWLSRNEGRLGLAWAREVIVGHDGNLSIDHRDGSRRDAVRIRLPLAPPPSPT